MINPAPMPPLAITAVSTWANPRERIVIIMLNFLIIGGLVTVGVIAAIAIIRLVVAVISLMIVYWLGK